MASVSRFRSIWSGWPGAPGYTNYYINGPLNPASDPGTLQFFRDFWNALAGLLPTGLTVQVQGTVDELDVESGKITNQGVYTAPSVVTGTATGNYSGTSGALIDWTTTTYRNGRRVRGRTYLVPLGAANTNYDTSGSLASNTITTIQTAAALMLTDMGNALVIYSRPTVKNPIGAVAPVTAFNVPDLAVVMRSRRI